MLVVLGNACRDVTFRVAALPEPGETLNALETESGLGGKGLNQAVAAARTGAIVRLVTAIGNDAAAGSIRAALDAENMTDRGLIEKPGDTDLSAIIVASSGENIIVTNAAQAAGLAINDIAACLRLESDDVMLLQGNLSAEVSTYAVQGAKAAGAKVVFNPAPYQAWCRSIAPSIDVLILNSIELERWSGAGGPDLAIAELDMPLGIVTCGPRGCLMKHGQEPAERFSAPLVKAKDATGAGDIFAGVFTASWGRSGDAAAAVRLALAAASDSVTRPGAFASIPSRAEIERMRRELA
jgi:ribokinase